MGKPDLACDPQIVQELRSRFAPDDPVKLLEAFRQKTKSPEAPAGTEKFTFHPPPGSSFPEARWHLWKSLARVAVFIRELYTDTDYKPYINSKAGPGSSGQAVVYSNDGTIIWIPSSKRLYSPNASGDLIKRLAVFFSPLQTEAEGKHWLGSHWHVSAAGADPAGIADQMAATPLDFSISNS